MIQQVEQQHYIQRKVQQEYILECKIQLLGLYQQQVKQDIHLMDGIQQVEVEVRY